ncbi:MAG: ATP-binding protein, partial [Nitrospirota bacterium]|nr:ATP-binding protein [Nitrospirota bacterium]
TAKNMERKIAELRDSVLSVRMVRIGTIFERYGTAVDMLARDTGKMLKFDMIGADTEVDKIIIEELVDPLMHLVRNAADHAIESPEVRMSLSKPAEGLIMISAYQKGNHVVVDVRDDGGGIDVEAVKAKAIKLGIYPKAYVDSLSRSEALEIVFVPGFSTREATSETSGRGVGLDVVKENIMRIGGAVAIETNKGIGTSFTLTVPATLAVVQALIIEDCGVRYAVALNTVTEIMHLSPEKSKEAEKTGIFNYYGKELLSVRLTEFFGKDVPLANTGGMKYGIIAGIAPNMLCIVVDRLIEEMDVVIKPLSPLIKTQGIAGATDMGEYGVMLIIDPNGILETIGNERKFSRI